MTTPALHYAGSSLPTCSVIICAYTEDRWDDILAAVASVQAQEPAPDELIVVVDHNPALQSRLAEHLPGVRVVANHNEQGLSGARNTGVELSTSDVVAFLDDDAAAQPGWLAGLARPYADPAVLGVGSRIDAGWDDARPAWWPSEFDWVVGCTYTGQRPGPVRNLIGASASFRRDLFDEGGFTTGIGRSAGDQRPSGCEETEFCIRVSQRRPDGIFLHTDDAAVTHHVPRERQTFAYFRTRCYAEGLSKSQITETVGVGDGLSSERTYSIVTLPLGVLRGIGSALRGDFAGLGRSAAIITGLAWTTAGYLAGNIRRALSSRRGVRQ